MTDLVARLFRASRWSERQDEPAPDWDALLYEAAERIVELESKEFFERYRRIKAEALGHGRLVNVGAAHRSVDGKSWQLHDNNSVHMQDVNVFIIEADDGS